MTASDVRLLSALPAFVTPDVRGAVAWYRDQMGFHVPRLSEDVDVDADVFAEVFAIVELAPGQGIHLKRGPALRAEDRQTGGYVHLAYGELVRIDRELGHRGVRRVVPLHDAPWGMTEMTIEDPGGHRLRLGSATDKSAPAGIVTLTPEIPVVDAPAAAAWSRTVMGFEELGSGKADPGVRVVIRGGARLQWASSPGLLPRNRPRADIWEVYLETAGLEALATELATRGARVLRGPEDTPYGMRELEIAGPEEATICFGEEIA
jgi:catechol 2,3-dioxygenase-like lactoylglutathione lyase family enzyme